MCRIVTILALFFGMLLCRTASAVEYVFDEISVPGSIWNGVSDINNLGQHVGTFRSADFSSHAYAFDGNAYVTFDFPGAEYTVPTAVNDAGVIAGFCVIDGIETGFVYEHGEFTTIALDNALGTRLWGINVDGEIVGSYASLDHVEIGFVISPTGVLRELFGPSGQNVIPTAIANDGTILGSVEVSPDGAPPPRGGVLISGSTYTELPQFAESLLFADLSDSGSIVGTTDVAFSPFGQTGFVFDNGAYSPFRFPGSRETVVTGINNSGALVGTWLPLNGDQGGAFLARPVPEPSSLLIAAFAIVLALSYCFA